MNAASLALVFTGGLLVTCGVYQLMGQSLTRLVLGLIMTGNGLNVLILAAGGLGPADVLTQAMILTAIVITLGTNDFGKVNPEEKGWTEAYGQFVAKLHAAWRDSLV